MKTSITFLLLTSLAASGTGCVNVAVLASIPSDAEEDTRDGFERRDTVEPRDATDDHEGKHLDDVLDPHDDDRSLDDH